MPPSKYGNPPFYEVFGVRYKVMDSSIGYKERGVASWYGKKFHGRKTSSGERYDMYAMTAAHKALPLPTMVRVTNLSNGKSVIVKVNDRGPFVKNRIIDMSYAAAIELDMTGAGTAMVEVEALTRGKVINEPVPEPSPVFADPQPLQAGGMFVQVGAFGESVNAEKLAQKLNDEGIAKAAVHKQNGEQPVLYRVRIGPLSTVSEYDQIVRRIENLAISETQLVIEPAPASGS
ncbi:MAG: septal ring lytic transglycosylase RlpA family protein [Gammaproteobacteria bacterium]